jgi:hypothetical protein
VSRLSQSRSLMVRVALVGGLVLAVGLGLAAAQFNAPSGPTNPISQQLNPMDPHTRTPDQEPGVGREMQARQLKRLREEHQKQVFSDTDRMVQLAAALNAEVDKGNKPTADEIKEVDELGKLAKRVSDHIKTQ